MLCVWDKKKLTLEQRQQLGGGGAQSIKVCYLFVFPFLRCLFVFLVLQCNDGGAKSKVNHTEEISRRCWKTGSLWLSLNIFWYWTTPVRWVSFLLYMWIFYLSRSWWDWSNTGAEHSLASLLMDIGWSLGLPGIDQNIQNWFSKFVSRGLLLWDLHSGDCVRTIRQGSFPNLVGFLSIRRSGVWHTLYVWNVDWL